MADTTQKCREGKGDLPADSFGHSSHQQVAMVVESSSKSNPRGPIGGNTQVYQVCQVYQVEVSWAGRPSKLCKEALDVFKKKLRSRRLLRCPYHLPRERAVDALLQRFAVVPPPLAVPCLREVPVYFR